MTIKIKTFKKVEETVELPDPFFYSKNGSFYMYRKDKIFSITDNSIYFNLRLASQNIDEHFSEYNLDARHIESIQPEEREKFLKLWLPVSEFFKGLDIDTLVKVEAENEL